MKELSTETDSFFRPNFFVNTPDINPMYLQWGQDGLHDSRGARSHCRPCGVYSGFELFENAALQGREEYLNSEKFSIGLVTGPRRPRVVRTSTCCSGGSTRSAGNTRHCSSCANSTSTMPRTRAPWCSPNAAATW